MLRAIIPKRKIGSRRIPPKANYSHPSRLRKSSHRGNSQNRGRKFSLREGSKRGAWWIWAPQSRGIYGPIMGSRDNAYQEGRMYVQEKFEVVWLNTIDKSKATQLLKARRMKEDGIPLRLAVGQRFKHKFIKGGK